MIAPGERVNHYQVLKLLGQGGMGQVYLAKDEILARKVAIKFLPDDVERDRVTRDRFVLEAKSAAALDHPFICKVYETGEWQGKAYIAMEYVEGTTLDGRLKEGRLPLVDALQITREIAEAIEHAHHIGIIHRDLKPANIMCTAQGHIKVMDFGLAKRIIPGGQAELTRTLTQASLTEQGAIAGTLAYMSPEQARGEKLDGRSDIFSLGIIMYEMVTGRHPFSKPNTIDTLTSILRDPPPSPHIKPTSVNPILNPILRKALAKSPAARYQNARDMIADITKVRGDLAGGLPSLLRGWRAVLTGGVFVSLLAAGLWLLLHQPSPPPPPAGPKLVSVIIADSQNRTGDAVFDGVLEKLLSISLAGSPYISVYDSKQARQQALQLRPGAEGQVDLELAQLISRRVGIHAVVGETIESSGSGYLIRVSAWDPTQAKKMAEISQPIKTKGDILKVADAISAKLSVELGAIPPESKETLLRETFTTSSLEAMNAYAKAQELDDLGKSDEAIQWLQKALDSDPDFGRAYAILAVVYYNQQQYQEAKNYIQEALKRLDQMTDREKYRTRGIHALITRNFKKATEEYDALLSQFPGDYVAHANLALAYFFARNMPKALEEGRLDIQHSPQSVTSLFNMTWYALAAGDFRTVEEEARALWALEPDHADVFVTYALSQLAQGRISQAAEAYTRLGALGPFGESEAATGLADLALYEGRLKDASAILDKGIPLDLKNSWAYNAADKEMMQAQILFAQGNKDRALQKVERILQSNRNSEMLFSAACLLLEAGRTERARALAAELSKKIEPEPQVYAKLVGGQMTLARGNKAGAIKILQEAQELLDTWLGRLLLGRAYLEAEAYAEAHSEFELCLKRQGEAASVFINDLPTFRYLPPVYYYLGRAQQGLGSDAAAASYQKFLKIKEKADPGDPLVEDARRRSAAVPGRISEGR